MDQVGVDWVIAAFEKAGLPVAPILKTASGRTFYRVEGGQRQMLGSMAAITTSSGPTAF